MITHRAIDTQSDRDFVISSWSASYRTSYSAGIIDMDAWATVMHAQLGRFLDRPNVRTVLAVERRDPTFLYGFITADTTVQVEPLDRGKTREWPALVYYCYVKSAYRETGIARGLFGAIGIDPRSRFLTACKTAASTRFASKTPLAKWNPLVARFATTPRSES